MIMCVSCITGAHINTASCELLLKPINMKFFIHLDLYTHYSQKQPLVGVLQNKWSQKFLKIHRKTPVTEFLFQKKLQAGGLQIHKKETLSRRFPENLVKSFRTSFSKKIINNCIDILLCLKKYYFFTAFSR